LSRREDRSPLADPGVVAESTRRVVHESLEADFEAEPGRAILDTGLELGLDMAYGCRVGACGACAVEVTAGLENVAEPDFIERDALDRYDLPPHVRLACRACVNGPIVIRTLEE
jgi:ferredoxin